MMGGCVCALVSSLEPGGGDVEGLKGDCHLFYFTRINQDIKGNEGNKYTVYVMMTMVGDLELEPSCQSFIDSY